MKRIIEVEIGEQTFKTLTEYADVTHGKPEAIAADLITQGMIHFAHGVSAGIDKLSEKLNVRKTS